MCGIAGKVSLLGEPSTPAILRAMIGQLGHRGPDELGFHCEGPAGLAHARLSIIDLSGGKQPMCNEDGSLWITFNGEIFNYIELREQLRAKGHRFATTSDTEVILHAYEEKGESCIHDFNGQWSFAIWDSRRRELFASRDRLGIRPFFHTIAGNQFLFASEIKSILAHGDVPRELDLQALDQVLTFWHTLPPRTLFRGISELPPGHCLKLADGQVRVWRYWRPDYPQEPIAMDAGRCAERLMELLLDATRLRLRADVPVGAYLSGGLDSSIITSLIRQFTDTPLKTFSVTFEDGEFDESRYQQDVVRKLNTDHQAVHCTSAQIGSVFPDVVWFAERPIIRTAPAPLYILSGLVRRNGYKVVLTGEGSDEILGGYDIFKEAKIRRFWGRQPTSDRRPTLLKKLYPWLQNLQNQPEAYRRAFFHVRPEDLGSPLFSHLPRWELTARLKMLYSPQTRAQLNGYDPREELLAQLPPEYHRWPAFCQAQYLETVYLLPGYILSSQGDRMAMGHSVEGRFPFLDYRVVEFAGTIPPRLKMRGLDEKHILKRAAGNLVPDSVRNRPKQPYRAPDAVSFFPANGRGSEPDYLREVLSESSLARSGLFNPLAVQALADKARRGQAIGIKDNMALVAVLSAQLVCEQFVHHFGRRFQHAGT